LVEKYLHGGFGTANEVGPYVASMFYAVDRYDHSFDMKKKLDAGTILVSDRYVSASMGHQAGKIDNLKERDVYLDWLDNLEFEIFKIPRPDLTIILYVDPETNQRLMASRPDKEYLKGKKTDIHEADLDHLRKAGEAFLYVARKFGWTIIDCAPKMAENPEGKLLSIDEIHEMIWKKVSEVLKSK
jgi:dTMP kinase